MSKLDYDHMAIPMTSDQYFSFICETGLPHIMSEHTNSIVGGANNIGPLLSLEARQPHSFITMKTFDGAMVG